MQRPEAQERFLTHLKDERRLSHYTLRNYRHALETFFNWLKKEHAWGNELDNIPQNYIRDFIIEHSRSKSRTTLHNWISALRTFYKYLFKQGILENNPFTAVTLPKLPKRLPLFLTEKQITALLEAPMTRLSSGAIKPFQAWRDRLAMELLYGGGLRISEVTGLTYGQIDENSGVARILGKGKKERLCPLGKVALECLKHFKEHYALDSSASAIVLTNEKGKPISPRIIQKNLKTYLTTAGLPIDLTPHKIRHSYATHLLNHGASLRLVQAMLGHASLSTTQIYTHIDVKRLQEAHQLAHPRG